MMARMTTTTTNTTTSKTSSTIAALNKPASTICGGFLDVNGVWNNGFACPVRNLVQYFCCGTDNEHFCCPLDRYLLDNNSSSEPIYISGQYEPSNHIEIDQTSSSSLTAQSNLINKQFEQFQKLFLPIFLLTSSILFLIGIAIWFWLYKHKAFYATEHDDGNERNRVVRRTSPAPRTDTLNKKRESINLTMQQQSHRMSHPSTEV